MSALLREANRAESSKRYDAAAASLERAIRIEPRNAVLWHRLSSLRFKQRDYQQCETLALRSNSFVDEDRTLRLENWRLIALARAQSGDADGAEAARVNMRQLMRQ